MSTTYFDDDSERYDPQAEQRAAEVVQAASAHWRSEALREYPAVTPLAEYLNGGSREEVMALAKDLSEKLGNSQAAPSGPSVPAGSPALGNFHPGDTDEVSETREAARKSPTNQNWSNYLRAKYAEAGIAYPGDE